MIDLWLVRKDFVRIARYYLAIFLYYVCIVEVEADNMGDTNERLIRNEIFKLAKGNNMFEVAYKKRMAGPVPVLSMGSKLSASAPEGRTLINLSINSKLSQSKVSGQ